YSECLKECELINLDPNRKQIELGKIRRKGIFEIKPPIEYHGKKGITEARFSTYLKYSLRRSNKYNFEIVMNGAIYDPNLDTPYQADILIFLPDEGLYFDIEIDEP